MATNFTVSVDEVSCPVCCDVFTNPVLLLCSHSVCKACLQQCWRDGTRKCPLCRRVAPPGANPPVNLALKNLCERFALEQDAGGGSETLCSLHQEKLLLFCLVDKQPICADCVSNLHNNHKLCHIKVAAQDHQMKVQEALKPLQEKLKNFHGIKDTVNQSMQHIKHQVQHTERQIKKEFKELHQFLHREEAARITALKQEEMQKSAALNRKMEETLRKIEALSATISTIEKDMGKEDALFLQNFNATMKRAQCTIREPDASGLLIDVAKHVGNLKYTVWEKMLGMVQYSEYWG
ncbi:hypothetical protein MATL_G00261260 [Megalops atlanticus]|uniref:Tripartite motif-containing protein 35-like n=1 Tax=Megalops atlanticus TaxID=7932 RepID=A0A9D3PA69_MEGAT|nr:hypothetical protein MATL_G00261260 [Megalops atlanticus]